MVKHKRKYLHLFSIVYNTCNWTLYLCSKARCAASSKGCPVRGTYQEGLLSTFQYGKIREHNHKEDDYFDREAADMKNAIRECALHNDDNLRPKAIYAKVIRK